MRILIVGALSWNPERIRSLGERGHELWGLWSRSTAWDQGPYPETEGCVRPIALQDAARTIRDQRIDCVYSLFQVYHPRLWGPPARGVEHDVWTLLRTLLLDRQRGAFDAPIVRHWGFDAHNLDPDVVRALDGNLFCNREKLEYWSTPARQGGCGLDLFGSAAAHGFLDSDRPMLEFMNDRFSAPLSDDDGEIHTVCIGRPFNVDYLAAARRGIHVHVYGNSVDRVYRTIAPDLSAMQARRSAGLLRRYLHVHTPLQEVRASWPEVRRQKSGWVEEFSRYDAAWSYIGSPLRWEALDDRAAIPNRVGTYLLAGLPVITDRRPGSYRYEELRRLDVDVEFVDSDYDELRTRLETEARTREKRRNARAQRHQYSFEATIEPLVGALEAACATYFAKPHAERSWFLPQSPQGLVHFETSPAARMVARELLGQLAPRRDLPLSSRLLHLVRAAWEERRRLLLPWRTWRLGRTLRPHVDGGGRDVRSPGGR